MAETELTKEIKKALLHYTKADAPGVYGCYEVCLGAGYGDEYVDFMTMSSTNVFRAYEIKISLSDLKSKAKLSFCGDYNYIVLPEELYQKETVIHKSGTYIGEIYAKHRAPGRAHALYDT